MSNSIDLTMEAYNFINFQNEEEFSKRRYKSNIDEKKEIFQVHEFQRYMDARIGHRCYVIKV